MSELPETGGIRPPFSHLEGRHYQEIAIGSGIGDGVIETRGYRTVNDANELLELGFSHEQASHVPGWLVPMWGVDGTIVGHQFKPDKPRLNKKGKEIKYETPAKWRMRLDVGPNAQHWLDDPAEPCWVGEGIKKGDSAAYRGLRVITLIGVWNWRGTNEKGGSVELSDWDRIALKGRVVFLCFDSDVLNKPEVAKALRRLAGFLKRRHAIVKIVTPPDDPNHPGKSGMDDFFVRGGDVTDIIDNSADYLLQDDTISTVGRALAEVADDGLKALEDNNIPPNVFVRANELVRVVYDERGIAKISGLTNASLRDTLSKCATWVKPKAKGGDVEIFPPREVVESIASRESYPDIPPLVAITKAPVLAPDGTLSEAPGYDPASGFFVAAKRPWPRWEGTLQDAVDLIYDVLVDFPFTGDPDRAHAIALMLLPIVRPYIVGPTPLHIIDAPVQGSGKSLLAKICLMPTMGDNISATPGTRDEEEWRKKIASSLLEGRAYLFLDNLSRKVDSDSLAGALTGTEWNDRALSTMRNINVPIRLVWVATSNNMEMSRDILRRAIWARLDSGLERPEDRTGFVHPDIEAWVTENRERIVSALCHVVRCWAEAGRKPFSGRRLGSFENWSAVVGGILENAGIPGFLGNLDELRSHADSAESAWAEFYSRWKLNYGTQPLKAGNLVSMFKDDDELAALLGDAKSEVAEKQRLGHLLKKRVGVVCGVLKIERAVIDSHVKTTQYRIVEVEPKTPQISQNPAKTPQPDSLEIEPVDSEIAGFAGFSGFLDYSSHTHAQARAGESADKNPQNPAASKDDDPPTNSKEIIL